MKRTVDVEQPCGELAFGGYGIDRRRVDQLPPKLPHRLIRTWLAPSLPLSRLFPPCLVCRWNPWGPFLPTNRHSLTASTQPTTIPTHHIFSVDAIRCRPSLPPAYLLHTLHAFFFFTMSSRMDFAAGFACNCIIYSIIYSAVNLYNFYRSYVRKFAGLCKLLCIFVLEYQRFWYYILSQTYLQLISLRYS